MIEALLIVIILLLLVVVVLLGVGLCGLAELVNKIEEKGL